MSFMLIYPAVAMLAMCVLGVIMVILKYGPKLCKVRHHALPDQREWEDDKAYDQTVSFA